MGALGFGGYILSYQRRSLREFAAVESLARQQTEELARAQRELGHAEKMQALGTLSAGVAHDFKNLLSVIRLSNDLIRRDSDDLPDVLEEVEAITKAVAQGDQVVKSMLGYSRREMSAEQQPLDVAQVIEETITLLGGQFLSGIQLQLDLSPNLPSPVLPRSPLEQILLNLVVNASEAMQGKGTLTITAKIGALDSSFRVIAPQQEGQTILISVRDDGPGMHSETLERIFDPFFTTKTVGADKGTGLGLATVYKIARDQELGLGVDSQPGEGATFELALPVQKSG